MSTSSAPERPAPQPSRTRRKVLAELRRSAPETRAVLAGLLLVLGAWVGPGLQREFTGAEDAEVAVTDKTSADPLVGGDAYTAAVGTASSWDGDAEPAVTDED